MQFDLGLQGFGIVVACSVIFGAVMQLALGSWAHSRWLWLIGIVGWLVGGLFFSEVLFSSATEADLQPIIDGLAFDESLLGGLLGGVLAVVGTALYTHGHTPTHHATPV